MGVRGRAVTRVASAMLHQLDAENERHTTSKRAMINVTNTCLHDARTLTMRTTQPTQLLCKDPSSPYLP